MPCPSRIHSARSHVLYSFVKCVIRELVCGVFCFALRISAPNISWLSYGLERVWKDVLCQQIARETGLFSPFSGTIVNFWCIFVQSIGKAKILRWLNILLVLSLLHPKNLLAGASHSFHCSRHFAACGGHRIWIPEKWRRLAANCIEGKQKYGC